MEIRIYCAKHSMYQLEVRSGRIDIQGNAILLVNPCPRCWNEGYEQGYEQGVKQGVKNVYERGGENGNE